MSHWDRDKVACRVCSSEKGRSLMVELAYQEDWFIFWCPLCGSTAKLYEGEPISFSDFTAPYVAFDKESCVRNGGKSVRFVPH
jgi:hypothetical protein